MVKAKILKTAESIKSKYKRLTQWKSPFGIRAKISNSMARITKTSFPGILRLLGQEDEEVGLVIENIPTPFFSLARLVDFIKRSGKIQCIKAMSTENRNNYFVSFSSNSETQKALENFKTSPFGKEWLEGIITSYIGTYSGLQTSQHAGSPLTELVEVLLEYEMKPTLLEELQTKFQESLLRLLIVLDKLAIDKQDQSMEEHIRLIEIIIDQPKPIRDRACVTLLEKAPRLEQSSPLYFLWNRTRELVSSHFLIEFESDPLETISLIENVLDTNLIAELSDRVSENILKSSTCNAVDYAILLKLAKASDDNYQGPNLVCQAILGFFKRVPQKEFGELLVSFGSGDQVQLGWETLKDLFIQTADENPASLFEVLLKFLDDDKNNTANLKSIVKEVVSNVCFTMDQIFEILQSKLGQSDLGTFREILQTSMDQRRCKTVCEDWVKDCQEMRQWMVRGKWTVNQAHFFLLEVFKFRFNLEVKPWVRDSAVNLIRGRSQGHNCDRCQSLVTFLIQNRTFLHLPADEETRECIQNNLQSDSGFGCTIASYLGIEVEEYEDPNKSYPSGIILIRKLPLGSCGYDEVLHEIENEICKISGDGNS